jgi:hypothetical protein
MKTGIMFVFVALAIIETTPSHATNAAQKAYIACLTSHIKNNASLVSSDGGKSALHLMAFECHQEYDAYRIACMATGVPDKTAEGEPPGCTWRAGMIAQGGILLVECRERHNSEACEHYGELIGGCHTQTKTICGIQ